MGTRGTTLSEFFSGSLFSIMRSKILHCNTTVNCNNEKHPSFIYNWIGVLIYSVIKLIIAC